MKIEDNITQSNDVADLFAILPIVYFLALFSVIASFILNLFRLRNKPKDQLSLRKQQSLYLKNERRIRRNKVDY